MSGGPQLRSNDLRARAERAAASLIAEHDLSRLGVSHDLLVPVLAVGWLEGWEAGMGEARETLAEALARYEPPTLHSVPS